MNGFTTADSMVLRPSANAILRPLYPWKPTAGSIGSLMIFSGVFSATSSISIPPSVLAINTGQPESRSTRILRYSSLAMLAPSSTSSRRTTLPLGPVWCVTSVLPSSSFAKPGTAAFSFVIFTPPALPRPPAWICAFTTNTGLFSSAVQASASCGVLTSRPRGTGTPNCANNSLAGNPGTFIFFSRLHFLILLSQGRWGWVLLRVSNEHSLIAPVARGRNPPYCASLFFRIGRQHHRRDDRRRPPVLLCFGLKPAQMLERELALSHRTHALSRGRSGALPEDHQVQ